MRAGLSDAVSLPIAGARLGPRQFVVGLGAGASSLIQHVSHGALTSVSDFTSAVATTLSDEDAAAPTGGWSANEVVSHISGDGSGGSHLDSALSGGMLTPISESGETPSNAPSAIGSVRRGLLGAVKRPVGGAMHLVSAASQSLIHTVSSAVRPNPSPLPAGLPLPRRASAAWCERALADTHEIYLCHTIVTPVIADDRADVELDGSACASPHPPSPLSWGVAHTPSYSAVHELLLSSGGLYLLRARRIALVLPTTSIDRLEAAPPAPAVVGAAATMHAREGGMASPSSPSTPRPDSKSGTSRRVLAVFVVPSEATRLGIPSCLQYTLPVHQALAFVTMFDVAVQMAHSPGVSHSRSQ